MASQLDVRTVMNGIRWALVFQWSRSLSSAEDQLDIVGGRALVCGDVLRLVRTVAGIEHELRELCKSRSEFAESDPDLVGIGRVDGVLEIDLALALIDAVLYRRHLDGDAGVDGIAVAPWLFISLVGGHGKVVRHTTLSRNGPGVDGLLAAVRNDGLGLDKGHESAEGENLADHAADR